MVQAQDSILRKEEWERDVKGFALKSYKMRQFFMEVKTNSWSTNYFQEKATDPTAKGSTEVRGIPRLSNFPKLDVNWELKTAVQLKHGGEEVVSYEDAISDNIDVVARTLLRIARTIVASADREAYLCLSENDSPTTINHYQIPAGKEWDATTVANRDPIFDIRKAIEMIEEYDYEDGEILIGMTHKDYTNLITNSKVISNPTFKQNDVVSNGKVARVMGATIVRTNAVSQDKCIVAIKGICGTWRTLQPLTVVTEYDPLIKYKIRAGEIGVPQLINPKAVTLISNTQK